MSGGSTDESTPNEQRPRSGSNDSFLEQNQPETTSKDASLERNQIETTLQEAFSDRNQPETTSKNTSLERNEIETILQEAFSDRNHPKTSSKDACLERNQPKTTSKDASLDRKQLAETNSKDTSLEKKRYSSKELIPLTPHPLYFQNVRFPSLTPLCASSTQTVMTATSHHPRDINNFPITKDFKNANLSITTSAKGIQSSTKIVSSIKPEELLKWRTPLKPPVSLSTLMVVHVNEIRPTLDSTLEEFHNRLKYQLEQEEASAENGDAGVDLSDKRFHLAWKMSQLYSRNKKGKVETAIPLGGTSFNTAKVSFRQRLYRLLRSSILCNCSVRRQNKSIELPYT